MPLDHWCHGWVAKAHRRLAEILNGVGCGPDINTTGNGVLHLRRQLSEAEIETIFAENPAWVTSPAIDLG